ncbi:MAG: DNA primase [Pirellulales bacterium]|nr:DNA primase [Pirellulales bacterium]
MSTSSPLDAKEQVRQAIDIVELVGSHIQLRRQGRNYVGLCPWHDDSRPSLQVNPERQSFRCWVCDIGGDVFDFVMKSEGVEFREALQMLAERAGVALGPSPSPAQRPVGGPGDKRTLLQAMAWAEQQYHRCLIDSPEAEPARQYLQRRGITAESIDTFHLGFSPNQRDWLLRQVGGSAERAKVLETIGLLARPADGGDPYDRFRGRVLFSIRDTQGRPVGLGGRVLPESGATSPAKYVNSPETPLFSKSNLLYGLDVARGAIRKNGTALVMEGYTDCIVAHQYGFAHAVAVLGTALGEGHIRILNRFADRTVLILDGDEAGQRRANEVLELFVAQQVDLQILTLPEGTDPCDFLQQHGAEAFAELLAGQAVDALEHAFRSATRNIDLQRDVHAATQALERLVAIVAKAPRLRQDTTRQDRFREEKILQRMAARFRVDETEIRRRLTALRRRGQTQTPRPHAVEEIPPGEQPAAIRGPIDPAWREMLEILIGHPECWPQMRAAVGSRQIAPEPCRRIYETCCRLEDAGHAPTFDRLMLEFDDPAVKSLLVELDEAGRAKGERDAGPEALLLDLITTLKKQEAQRQRPGQIVALREGGLNDSQETELLEQIIRQERSRQGISEPTDG